MMVYQLQRGAYSDQVTLGIYATLKGAKEGSKTTVQDYDNHEHEWEESDHGGYAFVERTWFCKAYPRGFSCEYDITERALGA